jgi:hypothetical protein
MDMHRDLVEIAHVEPLAAARAIHEMVDFGFGYAVNVCAGLWHPLLHGHQSFRKYEGTRWLELCFDCDDQMWRPTTNFGGNMYKLAVAILLLSAPAFAQDKSESKPDVPPTNMPNTVIPKSGGTQTPATTPTKAGETTPPDTTATRPATAGPQQTSVPNAAPPATTTQTTGATNQEPKVKEMNEEEKKKVETEGK